MATTTPNFSLRKPASTDRVNVALDIAGNMDLIDAHAHSGTYVRLGNLVIDATEAPYNADKTGAADARAAINSAITACAALGGGTVFLPAGTYKISSAPGVTLLAGVELVGAGQATVINQAYWPGQFVGLITATGTYTDVDVTGAVLTANVGAGGTAGSQTLTMTSTANLTVGSYYLLGSNRAYNDAPASTSNDHLRYRGEIVQIASVDSATQVTLDGFIRDNYATANAASLKAITYLENVAVRNLRIVNTAPATALGDAIKFQYVRNFLVDNVRCERIDGVGIHLDMCARGTVRDCQMIDLTDDIGAARFGYGINFNRATEDVTVTGLRVEGGRHAVTTNGVDNKRGVPRNIVISGGVSDRSNSHAWDTHAQGAGITFVGCSATNCRETAYNIRSADTRVVNCQASYVGVGASVAAPANGAQIVGNNFRRVIRTAGGANGYGISLGGVQQAVIVGNVVDVCTFQGMIISGGAVDCLIADNKFLNPGLQSGGNSGIHIQAASTATGLRIVRNYFSDAALGTEPISAGDLTYPIDIQATGASGLYVADNTSVGASQAVFVNDLASGTVKTRNRQLDRSEDASAGMRATGILAETFPRNTGSIASQTYLVSGRQSFVGIWLEAGTPVTSISFVSGGTAAVTPANQWFSIYDSSRTKLAVTADDTTTAWAAFTKKTLTVASGPYVVPTTGLYYFGIMVAAATVPSIGGFGTSQPIAGQAPKITGFDGTNTGLTNPASAPATAAAFSDIGVIPYAQAA